MKNKESKILHSKFYNGNKTNFILAIIGTTILSIAILSVTYLMKQVIDIISGSSQKNWMELLILGIIIIFMELFAGICTYYFRTSFSTKAVLQYRNYAINKILDKDIQNFNNERSSVYISSLTNDLGIIKEKYLDMIPIIIQILICCIGAILIMASYSLKLTTIAVVISFIPLIASIIAGKKLSKMEVLLSEKNSKYLANLKDILEGFSTIKTFKAENSFNRIHSKQCENVQIAQRCRDKVNEKVNYTAAISGYIAQFSILLACIVFSFYDKTITAGTIIAFSRLINYLIDPVTSLPSMLADTKSSLALVDRLGIILSNISQNNNSTKLPELSEAIKFENVSFSYSNDENNLFFKNINLEFIKGKCYIIVGGSGSGKSTILRLIMKIINPCSGNILYDKFKLEEIEESEVYNSIAYIQQEITIFNTSILNNITMYQNFSKEEITRVVVQSGLKELVDKKGLDYECGENGVFLSGGEKQRVAIARSLIKNKSILLADEITASLDKNVSFHVISSIMKLHGLTRILILHDLDENILRQADKIIVLKNGIIKEQGTFKELINTEDYFYSLFNVSKIKD